MPRPTDPQRAIHAAASELAAKPHEQIEEDTAWAWAARAIAAYQNFGMSDDPGWLYDCLDYRHEALEHAALADPGGDVLHEVRAWVREHVPIDAD